MALGQHMNCFEWQSRVSDYLDGELSEPERRQAEEHTASCRDCGERSKHYRLLLSSIASQPRMPLPSQIRKAPFSIIIPKLEAARIGRSRWEQVPWYIRTPLEGTVIVLLILLGISTGPKIRTLYEKSLERSFSEFSDALTTADLSLREGTVEIPPLVAQSAVGTDASKHDDFSGENEDDSEEEESPSSKVSADVRVGRSEMWRIIVKTDSPHELRAQVLQAFADTKLPADTPGLGGVKYPGGIKFDLEVPSNVVLDIKQKLEAASPKTTGSDNSSIAGQPFSWYKVKSKRRIPEGKTRVVIFLHQI